jgi:hypothetical protein
MQRRRYGPQLSILDLEAPENVLDSLLHLLKLVKCQLAFLGCRVRLRKSLAVLVKFLVFILQFFQFALHQGQVLLRCLVVTSKVLQLLLSFDELLLKLSVFSCKQIVLLGVETVS